MISGPTGTVDFVTISRNRNMARPTPDATSRTWLDQRSHPSLAYHRNELERLMRYTNRHIEVNARRPDLALRSTISSSPGS
jgi:hypothetical protein